MDPLDQARMEERKKRAAQLNGLMKAYEDSLEPKIVLLFRKLEEMIARSQMPLTHINLVLDMLKAKCVEMSIDAYVERGAEKLPKAQGKQNA